jgi:hypothetical protein
MWKRGGEIAGRIASGLIFSQVLRLFGTGNLFRCLPISASDSNLERRGKTFDGKRCKFWGCVYKIETQHRLRGFAIGKQARGGSEA